jgi:hypothetical protein
MSSFVLILCFLSVGVSAFRPRGSLDRRVKLSLRAPAQMGWRETGHEGGVNLGSCYPAPEWVRLQ